MKNQTPDPENALRSEFISLVLNCVDPDGLDYARFGDGAMAIVERERAKAVVEPRTLSEHERSRPKS